MAEQPEHVLPQDRLATSGRVEEVGTIQPVKQELKQGHGNYRHSEDD